MRSLCCADKILTFEHPRIMGVLNITPDSFSDGGQLYAAGQPNLDQVCQCASEMIAAGAAVLDIGGESTRPGAQPVSVQEELDRVIPVLNAVHDFDTIVSVDTRHAEVAAEAIKCGAHLINDVSAGSDPDMLSVIASSTVGYALMHMQGTPATMQQAPSYSAVVADVRDYLDTRYHACLEAGIEAERLMIDPGFGFGKSLDHNLALLAELATTRIADRPLLVGLSRKSMLGKISGREVGDRIHISVAASLLAAERGADLLRVHDVAATQDALALLIKIQEVGG